MLRLVVFFREGKVPWGKSDLGIWLRLLIREEKSGNKLSSPPSPQYTMGQSAARILLINPLAPTSYGAFIFVWWFWRLSYLREVISKHVDFEAALSPRARRMDGVREYEDEAQEVAASSSPQSLLYHCITMLQPLHIDRVPISVSEWLLGSFVLILRRVPWPLQTWCRKNRSHLNWLRTDQITM